MFLHLATHFCMMIKQKMPISTKILLFKSHIKSIDSNCCLKEELFLIIYRKKKDRVNAWKYFDDFDLNRNRLHCALGTWENAAKGVRDIIV